MLAPDVLASLCRILDEAISLHYRTWAKSVGNTGAQTGAVSFVRRFGSSLNLHTHFHVVVLDGVYGARGEGVAFFASPPPTREALEALVKRVVVRAKPGETDTTECAAAWAHLKGCREPARRANVIVHDAKVPLRGVF